MTATNVTDPAVTAPVVTYPVNVTYNGITADLTLSMDADIDLADLPNATNALVRSVVEKKIRAGAAATLHIPDLPAGTLKNFKVDLLARAQGPTQILVRPEVPFGGAA